MVSTSGSQYLQWVKTRTAARLNLASSGVAPYPLRDLTVGIDELEINGTTFYGYPPLQEAIAAHCGVSPNCVVAASGTSMANFLAMATLINSGDEVCIEQRHMNRFLQ
jgi:aspartate/methionine/tyrosine aminotransferase